MKRASDLFSEHQRQSIDEAVQAAETRTSSEIVPVVASVSGRYDRAEDIVGLWLATVAAAMVWLIFPRTQTAIGSWEASLFYPGLLLLIIAIGGGFIIGSVIASRFTTLRRLFIPRQEMLEDVASRAREVFFDRRIHHTTEANGLLIYVSLYERVAIVLGDQKVVDKLGQDSLDQLCSLLTVQLKKGKPTEALCAVIDEAGAKLATHLPRTEEDKNELADALILLD